MMWSSRSSRGPSASRSSMVSPSACSARRQRLPLPALAGAGDLDHVGRTHEGVGCVERVEGGDQPVEPLAGRRCRTGPRRQPEAVSESPGEREHVDAAGVAHLLDLGVERVVELSQVGGGVRSSERVSPRRCGGRRTARPAASGGASASRRRLCSPGPRAARRTTRTPAVRRGRGSDRRRCRHRTCPPPRPVPQRRRQPGRRLAHPTEAGRPRSEAAARWTTRCQAVCSTTRMAMSSAALASPNIVSSTESTS